MPRYADISDSEPTIPKDLPPSGWAPDELDADNMAELRLPRAPAPPTCGTWNPDPGGPVGDCC